jgi:hypothetical protein
MPSPFAINGNTTTVSRKTANRLRLTLNERPDEAAFRSECEDNVVG